MRWWLPRTLASWLLMLLLAGVGALLGDGPAGTAIGALVGGALGVGSVNLRDALRSHRLMDWLREGLSTGAPRDEGYWGELGYRIEKALRDRERMALQEQTRLGQFLSAIEASPNGVLLLDASEQIEWFNSQAADHFGLDPARDRRQHLTYLVREPSFVAYLQSGAFHEPLVFEVPSPRRQVSVLVRTYGEGMKLLLSQDITERDRAESMRRDFVANVSHEIRTPLTVLSGFVETLANLPLAEDERRRVLDHMARQTARMQDLVSDLLTLARLEGSPRPPLDHWVDLQALLARIEADARALSGGRHVIHVETGPLAEVAGSEAELHSAVGNLLGNAIRYTPQGGRIDLVWSLRADGTGEVAVVDTGPGIAREHLPRLTERFYRADASRSRDTGGTGLGLSIVKHVAQRHGGQIQIESELGKGSRFMLVLPGSRLRTRVPLRVGAETPT